MTTDRRRGRLQMISFHPSKMIRVRVILISSRSPYTHFMTDDNLPGLAATVRAVERDRLHVRETVPTARENLRCLDGAKVQSRVSKQVSFLEPKNIDLELEASKVQRRGATYT
jgi:hypothetical protein